MYCDQGFASSYSKNINYRKKLNIGNLLLIEWYSAVIIQWYSADQILFKFSSYSYFSRIMTLPKF